MGHQSWSLIIGQKWFNIRVYRKGLLTLIVFLILNGLLALLICYFYLKWPEPDYYASNGSTPPVQLQARLTPNESDQALLEPDPPIVNEEKTLPQ